MSSIQFPDLDTVSTEELPALYGKTMEFAAQVQLKLGFRPQNGSQPRVDRFLDVDQAAAKLNCSPQWLYKHMAKLPFRCKREGLLRFSEIGIERYMSQGR